MTISKCKFKPFLGILFLGIGSLQTHAKPTTSVIVQHPIHYKPFVQHMAPSGLTPTQVSNAYGFSAIKAKGKGQVIGIIDAYDDPHIEADLAVFNREFGLPACTTKNGCFKKIYAQNKKPKTDAGWSGEIALDVEWAHAMAPAAQIILVEAASSNTSDLFEAIQVAVKKGATVVSMSWGAEEFDAETVYDPIFNNPNVSFTASAGDNGTDTLYPAASPNVIAVGGSTLTVDFYGNYQGETAWSGTGGGVSKVQPWPTYQSKLPIPQSNNMRGLPDVAYNADPETGFSVYNSVPGDGGTGWQVVGGTSAGAPQWAAIIAIANSTLNKNIGNNIHDVLYALYSSETPKLGGSSSYFNDISTGSNGTCGFLCTAQPGYDYLTGIGSPEVANLIPALATH